MFCGKCGTKINDEASFCSNCGASVKVNASPYIEQTKAKRKLPIKPLVIFFVILSVVLVLVIGVIPNITPKKVDFNIKYERTEIQEFMDIVCKNANVELAQVGRVGYDGAGFDYGTYYAATLTVKPHNMVKEEIQVRFYNSGDTDKVSSIVVFFYDSDSENEKVCRDAIVEALEISFCGTSKAKEHTDKFNAIGTNLTIYDDAQIIANYSLTSEASVRISCDGSFADDWTGRYCIYKN